MILKELLIYSLIDKKILKKYIFNDYGLNIILGEKREDLDEANGVGKTTLIESLRYILGGTAPKDFINSKKLAEKDIFLVLKVINNKSSFYLARRILNNEKGYIWNEEDISFNLGDWKVEDKNKYKTTIHDMIFNNRDIPNFSALREYIIRDEKKGFMEIHLPNRQHLYQHMYLSFLFGLPYQNELEIKELKKPIKKLKDELKIIKSISKEINELKITKPKLEQEITELEDVMKEVNIPKKYDLDASRYTDLKKELNKVQKLIFEKEHIIKQYNKNIENLEKKVEEIKELEDIAPFFQQLTDYFPNEIEKNFTQISKFYNFMVQNRGKYFEGKINDLKHEIRELYKEKSYLLKEINDKSQIFNNKEIMEDITNISKEINKKNQQLANINAKIDIYDNKNKINKEINKIKQDIIKLTQIKEDKFNSNEDYIEYLEESFNNLLHQAYNEKGILDFEYDNRTGQNDTTGRTKVRCKIDDEKSHGRLYMKINIFDLTWYLNRVKNGLSINFLVHDGSYCKPDKDVKVKLLKYVDAILNSYQRGQYFITINIDELNEKDLKYFKDNDKVVVKLDKSNGHKNRFFGFKYN